jgi:hypothetical protein
MTVAEIKEAIRKLTPEEQRKLLEFTVKLSEQSGGSSDLHSEDK